MHVRRSLTSDCFTLVYNVSYAQLNHCLNSVKYVCYSPYLSGNRFSVQDHAVFPAHVRVEDLKTKMLGLPPDAFLLHLTPNHLRASSAVIVTAQSR